MEPNNQHQIKTEPNIEPESLQINSIIKSELFIKTEPIIDTEEQLPDNDAINSTQKKRRKSNKDRKSLAEYMRAYRARQREKLAEERPWAVPIPRTKGRKSNAEYQREYRLRQKLKMEAEGVMPVPKKRGPRKSGAAYQREYRARVKEKIEMERLLGDGKSEEYEKRRLMKAEWRRRYRARKKAELVWQQHIAEKLSTNESSSTGITDEEMFPGNEQDLSEDSNLSSIPEDEIELEQQLLNADDDVLESTNGHEEQSDHDDLDKSEFIEEVDGSCHYIWLK